MHENNNNNKITLNTFNKDDLDKAIRKIRDFPKKGILFYDITSVLMDPEAFNYTIRQMISLYAKNSFDAIAAIEARGFLFAAPCAHFLGLPLILVRKKGKLPGETIEKSFMLEYGEDIIQIHRHDIIQGGNILLLDDLIATGGTLKASAELIKEGGAKVKDIFGIIGLPFLNYHEVLKEYTVKTLIDYHTE